MRKSSTTATGAAGRLHSGLPIQPDTPTHIVQFYEEEDFLFGFVADFLAGGLANGQSALVIATEAHRNGFLAHLLRSSGIDTVGACLTGQLTLLDARVMLASFMVGDLPDPARFRAAMGSMIERGVDESDHSVVCAYGEMVDLLHQEGNTAGALRLEALWNELADRYSFSLLCAYSIKNFSSAHTAAFSEICHQHQHVFRN